MARLACSGRAGDGGPAGHAVRGEAMLPAERRAAPGRDR